MAPLHEETGIGSRVRCRKHGEEIVERLGMGQKPGDAEARIQHLSRAGIQERPPHGDPEENDQALLNRRFVHGLLLSQAKLLLRIPKWFAVSLGCSIAAAVCELLIQIKRKAVSGMAAKRR